VTFRRTPGTSRRLCTLIALLTSLAGRGVAAQAAPEPGTSLQVYLMTMGPGAEIWERFGHNAIWIHDSAAETDRIYNYGMFSFGRTLWDQLNFYRKFLMGHPRYRLAVSTSLDEVLAEYTYFQRDVAVQELRLPAAAKLELAQRLATNAEPDNAEYPYDYFLDNCSTRVRDMLDRALGGALRAATVGKPAEGTYRFHTLRSLTNNVALFLGIDIGLGPPVDRPLDQWGEMFLPAKVMERVAELEVPGPGGSPIPLVERRMQLLDIGAFQVAPAPPHWGGKFLGVSLLIGALMATGLLPRARGIAGRALAGAWLVLSGAAGCLLLFLWLATTHTATVGNRNVLLLSPLALGLLRAFRRPRDGAARSWFPVLATLLTVSIGIGVALALVPRLGGQESQLVAAATTVPSIVAVTVARRTFSRKLASAPPPPA
jgi:hypothetical protein